MKLNRYISEFLKEFTNAKEIWNYEDGCVLVGLMQLFCVTKEQEFLDFILKYMDQFITEEGQILTYDEEEYNIDSIHTGKVLLFLYETTGVVKYKTAAELLMNQLQSHPRTNCGNYWHKKIYPYQIWLDGLYMAQPFYMAYDSKFRNGKNYKDCVTQFQNVRKNLYHKDKGLYYHAYDESLQQPWADKTTGLSKNFWLRAMGWYLMALIDTMDVMPREGTEDSYHILKELFIEAVDGLLQYQDGDSKLFFQIIDGAHIKGNYLETSGSAMAAYAILKGCGLRVLPAKDYQEIGEGIFGSLCDSKLVEKNGRLMLTDICSVAGLGPGMSRDGSTEYYLSEPIVNDDHKGTGVLFMAYAWLLKLEQLDGIEANGNRKEQLEGCR